MRGGSSEKTPEITPKPSTSSLTGVAANARGIASVVYSHIIDHDISSFTNFIFPSMDTWITNESLFVVLIEKWRENYYTDVCPESNDGA
jgi:hypothetical protein